MDLWLHCLANQVSKMATVSRVFKSMAQTGGSLMAIAVIQHRICCQPCQIAFMANDDKTFFYDQFVLAYGQKEFDCLIIITICNLSPSLMPNKCHSITCIRALVTNKPYFHLFVAKASANCYQR